MAPEVIPNMGIVHVLEGETITYDDSRGGIITLKGPVTVRYWEYSDPGINHVVLQPSIGKELRIPRKVFDSWPKIE